MANRYYNNALEDGDTMPASSLEAIETGFGTVQTEMDARMDVVTGHTTGEILSADANGQPEGAGLYKTQLTRRRFHLAMTL